MKTRFIITLLILISIPLVSQNILAKFEGKVLYVDFWGTYCSPCRATIEHIKPLKEDFKNDSVVFVYIANETSPYEIWANLTKNIKGEHFYLSADEWNVLTSKYKVNGIPHTILLDKKGVIRNSNVGMKDNVKLKAEIQKLLDE